MDGCMYLLAFTSYNATFSFPIFSFLFLLTVTSSRQRHLQCAHLSGLLQALLCHFSQLTSAHGHSPFPTVMAWGRQWRHQLSSSACLSHQAAGPHVFIVDCHLSVNNAFVSIFSLCKLLIFLLLHLPSPPSQISPGRFMAQHWQQQRGGFIRPLSLKRAVTQPHSIISTSSDSALDTFNQVPSARITTFIKVMNHSGA